MHELAICESLLRQVLIATRPVGSQPVARITLRMGPLAGVDPDLVRFAFPLVAAGTSCEAAVIAIEEVPVQVRCQLCRATSRVKPNRLLCASCGAWRVTLVTGDEMILGNIIFRDDSHEGALIDV